MMINVFHSCDGNSGFFHDLIFVAVLDLELDGIVWFIIGSVCKLFCSLFDAVRLMNFSTEFLINGLYGLDFMSLN